MIIEQKQTHIAYHCPHCGTAVLGYVGEFALSADMLKLKCECGKSDLSVTYTNDKKVRLTVPCLFCESPHHYVLTQKVFFERETLVLACPYTGVDICFIGKPEALQKELDRSAKELNALYEENQMRLPAFSDKEDGEDEEEEDTRDFLADPQIYDIVRFVISDLTGEGAISCPCGVGGYEVEIVQGGVRVYCLECGAERIFPINSVSAAQDFLSVDSITLAPSSSGR